MDYKNFSDFMEGVIDSARLSSEQKNMKELIKIVKSIHNNMDTLIKMAKNNDERISAINENLFEMFPEVEVIQTMTEDKEERAEMYSSYLNLNDEYL